VAAVDAFSGHADRQELTDYVKKLSGSLAKITVVHGEEEQSLGFANSLRSLLPESEIIVPQAREVVEF
jgi:metallo-beta-lactamase family protein